jgi:hypothetical protein
MGLGLHSVERLDTMEEIWKEMLVTLNLLGFFVVYFALSILRAILVERVIKNNLKGFATKR